MCQAGFDQDGTALWAQRFGTTANDSVRDFALAPDGSVYILGNNSAESDFGDGPLIPNGNDPFLFRLERSP